jgi:hypothetical protein
MIALTFVRQPHGGVLIAVPGEPDAVRYDIAPGPRGWTVAVGTGPDGRMPNWAAETFARPTLRAAIRSATWRIRLDRSAAEPWVLQSLTWTRQSLARRYGWPTLRGPLLDG